jgi:hypothetical protein
VVSVGGSYTNGLFKLGVGYFHAKHPGSFLPDGHYIANTTGAAIGSAGPWSYVGQPDTVTTLGAGATYALGEFSVGALFTHVKFGDANGTKSNVVFDDYDVSLNYAVTPATRVGVVYLYTAGRVDYLSQRPEYHRIAAGINTSLSKRTELYAVVVAQQATGDAKGADIYQGSAASMSSTNRQIGTRVAILHRF